MRKNTFNLAVKLLLSLGIAVGLGACSSSGGSSGAPATTNVSPTADEENIAIAAAKVAQAKAEADAAAAQAALTEALKAAKTAEEALAVAQDTASKAASLAQSDLDKANADLKAALEDVKKAEEALANQNSSSEELVNAQKALASAEKELLAAQTELTSTKLALTNAQTAQTEAEKAAQKAKIAQEAAEKEAADAKTAQANAEQDAKDAKTAQANAEQDAKDAKTAQAEAETKVADAETKAAEADAKVAKAEQKVADVVTEQVKTVSTTGAYANQYANSADKNKAFFEAKLCQDSGTVCGRLYPYTSNTGVTTQASETKGAGTGSVLAVVTGPDTNTLMGSQQNAYSGFAIIREAHNLDNPTATPVNSYVTYVETPTTDKAQVVNATYRGVAHYTTANKNAYTIHVQPLTTDSAREAETGLTLIVNDGVVTGKIDTSTTVANAAKRNLVTLNEATVYSGNGIVGFSGDATFNGTNLGLENTATNISGTYSGQFAGTDAKEVVGVFSTDSTEKSTSVQGAFAGQRQE
ncbi:hypothetical protein [Lonepinella sp. BR2357]|uniref:hypothetical protein n=1 Tax=Lonepinella sp. BR2357 TaxID=3434549 RepID=UPI003F6DEA4B